VLASPLLQSAKDANWVRYRYLRGRLEAAHSFCHCHISGICSVRCSSLTSRPDCIKIFPLFHLIAGAAQLFLGSNQFPFSPYQDVFCGLQFGWEMYGCRTNAPCRNTLNRIQIIIYNISRLAHFCAPSSTLLSTRTLYLVRGFEVPAYLLACSWSDSPTACTIRRPIHSAIWGTIALP